MRAASLADAFAAEPEPEHHAFAQIFEAPAGITGAGRADSQAMFAQLFEPPAVTLFGGADPQLPSAAPHAVENATIAADAATNLTVDAATTAAATAANSVTAGDVADLAGVLAAAFVGAGDAVGVIGDTEARFDNENGADRFDIENGADNFDNENGADSEDHEDHEDHEDSAENRAEIVGAGADVDTAEMTRFVLGEPDADATPLQWVSTDAGVCLPGGCFTPQLARKLKEVAARVVATCRGDAACVLKAPAVRQTANADREFARELAAGVRLKPFGPRNQAQWLTNFDIDRTLRRWAGEFRDFFPCPFAMIDFAETNDALGRVDMRAVARGLNRVVGEPPAALATPCQTFGCVVNTDSSRGPGIHWVCVFVDMRAAPPTVEFFDSLGRPPPMPLVRWLAATADKIGGRVVIASQHRHQQSNSECGVYALFYIRARLDGVPLERFAAEQIADSAMLAFRQHLFADPGEFTNSALAV